MQALNENQNSTHGGDMEKQLSFLIEIDKLKNVIRKSPLIDQSRRENSAEHSWHLALYALVLAGEAGVEVNVDRVIRMLLLHIVEIDAGDHPIHESIDSEKQQQLEFNAAQRIFGLLPEEQAKEMLGLWLEFEAGESDDAAFAKSLDRFQPLIHNIETGGGTWIEANVTKTQVKERYGRTISAGSASIWCVAEKRVDEHFD
ncbi:MAG: HD domain-containing protein [Ketobacter sp.]|nr:HD domain-containing protein [Ketobacter sp.]